MSRFKKVGLGVVCLLSVAIVVFMAATWAPDRPVESLKARWAPPPSNFLTLDGMQVHLRDEGPRDDPAPIVLLHGTSASLHTWEGWATVLRDKHRVVRFDLPGFGLTGPHPQGRYDGKTYTSFVSGMLDQLGIRACVLGGNSLGGYIAWKTALVDSRVRKLVLVDSGGYPNPNAKMPLGFKLAKMPGLKMLISYSMPRSVVEKSLRNVYGDSNKVTSELIDRYYELALREGNRAALVKRFEQTTYDAIEEVPRINVPTLILWGGQDRLIAPEFAARFQHDIKNTKVVMFDSLGHVPQEEDPGATVAPVVTFIENP